jgi:transcriptional regulator with XRE-family HTH domain
VPFIQGLFPPCFEGKRRKFHYFGVAIMTSHEIGKAIKAKRKSLRLTQSQVVGDEITRNMLSQIESGAAQPSFKTLTFLTERLGLSFSVVDPSEKAAVEESFLGYVAAKSSFHDGAFSAVLGIAENTSISDPLYDEFMVLKARAAIELAESSYIRRDFDACIDYAAQAKIFAESGLFANKDYASQAENLIKIAKTAAGKDAEVKNA